LKNGKAWGKKEHVWPSDQNTTTGWVDITGLSDLSVENLYNWTIYVRVLTPGSVTNVDIQANEVPDAPAADWMSVSTYPNEVDTTTGQERYHCIGCYHKRIRVRVQASSAGCTATVRAVFLGTHNWVELEE